MFEATVIKLLEGAFICRTAFPDLFSYLEDESTRRQVDGYLTQIGRRLAESRRRRIHVDRYGGHGGDRDFPPGSTTGHRRTQGVLGIGGDIHVTRMDQFRLVLGFGPRGIDHHIDAD